VVGVMTICTAQVKVAHLLDTLSYSETYYSACGAALGSISALLIAPFIDFTTNNVAL
jgi:hypothetical protein